jgi:hypothetical protein
MTRRLLTLAGALFVLVLAQPPELVASGCHPGCEFTVIACALLVAECAEYRASDASDCKTMQPYGQSCSGCSWEYDCEDECSILYDLVCSPTGV